VPILEQELPTLPEHMSLPPGYSEVGVTRSLILCVMQALHSSYVLQKSSFTGNNLTVDRQVGILSFNSMKNQNNDGLHAWSNN